MKTFIAVFFLMLPAFLVAALIVIDSRNREISRLEIDREKYGAKKQGIQKGVSIRESYDRGSNWEEKAKIRNESAKNRQSTGGRQDYYGNFANSAYQRNLKPLPEKNSSHNGAKTGFSDELDDRNQRGRR